MMFYRNTTFCFTEYDSGLEWWTHPPTKYRIAIPAMCYDCAKGPERSYAATTRFEAELSPGLSEASKLRIQFWEDVAERGKMRRTGILQVRLIAPSGEVWYDGRSTS